MTPREFIDWVSGLPMAVKLAALLVPPVAAWLLRFAHGREGGKEAPWKYVYSILTYWVCVPGVLSAVLTAYTLFFTGENLLDKLLMVYLFPIVSMAATLILIRKNVSFADIPGFDRLSGLIAVLAVTFILVLAVHKTRLWLVFGGSIYVLTAFVLSLFGLLQWGAYALFRRRDEPKREPPSLSPPGAPRDPSP